MDLKWVPTRPTTHNTHLLHQLHVLPHVVHVVSDGLVHGHDLAALHQDLGEHTFGMRIHGDLAARARVRGVGGGRCGVSAVATEYYMRERSRSGHAITWTSL